MILTADVGNSHTVFGIWSGSSLKFTARIATRREFTGHEWFWLLQNWICECNLNEKILKAVYCSVVPAVNSCLEEAFKRTDISVCMQISAESKLPFEFDYDNYKTLGADRIANVIAGLHYYGNNLIIADFGTAITFCLITEGVYRGGVIAPGIHSSLDALFSKTAKLPEISFHHKSNVLGKSTVESIENGAYYGWRGLIKEIIAELKTVDIAKSISSVKVIATGGIAEDLGFSRELFDIVDRNLTLKGLYLASEL